MVYVFGVEVPLVELMMAIVVLIFAMLIITLLEVKKLRKLIRIERTDILDLESMKKDPVDDFVTKAFAKGLKRKDIIETLKKAGWKKEQIDKTMAKYP